MNAFLYTKSPTRKTLIHVTPVLHNTEGDTILINTAKGLVKDKNLRQHPAIALCIKDPSNSFRYFQLHGRLIDITEQGVDVHIDKLAGKNTGTFKFQNHVPGIKRAINKIMPSRINAHG